MNDSQCPPCPPLAKRLGCFELLSLAAVALAVGANPPPPANPGAAPAAPAAAAPLPMDVPLRLLTEARQSYQNVKDYSCLFVKRENIQGQLRPENVVEMKVRGQPFSVYLHWLGPQAIAGQEACYVAGRNNGQMRVHATGIRAVAGFVSLDPRDPRVMQNNRHPITDAGIGNLIERFSQRWENEKRLNQTQVRVGEYDYNQRRCTRVEMIHPANNANQFYAYRSVIYFDKDSHLPIRVENYDWPRQGGPADGELLECYSYVNLRLNVGLGEEVFNH